MAGPLSGIGAGVSVPPIANNSGSAQNNRVDAVEGQDNQVSEPGVTQNINAAPAETTESQTQNTDVTAQEESFFAANQSEEDVDRNAPPGSLVDISV